jgi:chloramphenicol-sensitive protein RarD
MGMSDERESRSQFRAGLVYGLIAYVIWGLIPLYFHAVSHVAAGEILAHRIVWSFPILLVLVACLRGGLAKLRAVLLDRRLVAILLGSAALLSINWLLYIYATITQRVAEASLGYYVLPLVNAFLATLFLGERLRPAHYPALGLIALGVAIPFAAEGDFTWLAVALPVSFGCYGLVRKMVPVDSLTGLTVETLLMLVPAVGFLAYCEFAGLSAFGPDWTTNGLLILSGILTVIPLLTYTLSIRRIPLLTQAFIQFVSPSVQFLLAVFVMREPMPPERWAAILCVWLAVLLFIADAARAAQVARRSRAAAPELAVAAAE